MQQKNVLKVPVELIEYRGGEFTDDGGRLINFKKLTCSMFGREFIVNSAVDLSAYTAGSYIAVFEVTPVPKVQSVSFKVLALESVK